MTRPAPARHKGNDTVCARGSHCADVHSPTAIATANNLPDFVVREDPKDAHELGNIHEG